jgi:glycine betaine/proline transport system substrate-binding protein
MVTLSEGKRMSKVSKRGLGIAVSAVVALMLSACGGGVNNAATSTAPTGAALADCGTWSVAMNPWVGYTASASVVAEVARQKLGCTINQKDLDEQVSWQGFQSGEVDLVVENWGHPDLVKKYITDANVAVDLGSQGNQGIIGYYVPPWFAKAHPDVTDWKNLNKYADLFKNAESKGKGDWIEGDPSYVTNGKALVKNLKLNFNVRFLGSEAALIEAFRAAETNQKAVIGYFYEPQWFLSEVPLVKVNFPAYTDGCDADPAKVACDYPPYPLNKVASKKLVDSGSNFAILAKNFKWTNDDQNAVAKDIEVNKMDPKAAADKWIAANPDKVAAWLQGTK